VPWLDCHSLGSALASLADAIGTTPAELEQALQGYDEGQLEDTTEDPWERMPREVLERLGIDIETVVERFDGAYYFHGTRAIDPEAFRQRGILPLDQMVDELWATLREFAGDEITNEKWAEFRRSVEAGAGVHDGFLYRLKTGGRIHFGPFGLVVRETFFEPGSTRSHDCLGCPEIVEDIAACFASAHEINLERHFCDAAKPCIVMFRSATCRPGDVKAALWYAYTKLRGGEISSNSNYSYDGEGKAVAAEDVVNVEIVE
jgi:hypothetical protein